MANGVSLNKEQSMKQLSRQITALKTRASNLIAAIDELQKLFDQAVKEANLLAKENEKLKGINKKQQDYITWRNNKEKPKKVAKHPYNKPLPKSQQLKKLLSTLKDATVLPQEDASGVS